MKKINLSDRITTPAHEHKENQITNSTSTFSFMSTPLATRLSTFTNYIPLSWAPLSSQVETTATQPSSSNGSTDTQTMGTFSNDQRVVPRRIVVSAREKCFVPRERQLQRLKLRLDQERATRELVDVCRACSDTVVVV